MAETRIIVGHASHAPQGPHLGRPADFAPLQLCIEVESMHIEVVCPVAIVGRHTEADLRLACSDISRRHCKLAFEAGQWRVVDLRSLNGTYVNNKPALEATLYTGDRLRIGGIEFLVVAGTPVSIADEQQHAKLRQIVDVLPPEKAA